MLTISDKNDSSGQGMFSRAGRISGNARAFIERTFQQKEAQYLNSGQIKKYSASIPYKKLKNKDLNVHQGKNQLKQDHLSLAIQNQTMTNFNKKNGKAFDQTQPFAKQISKNDYHYQKSIKTKVPPCGHYNPKYSETKKRVVLVWDILQANKRRVSTGDKDRTDYKESIDPEKVKKRVTGFIHMNRQLSRDQTHIQSDTVHEKRFQSFDFSEVSTRVPKKQNIRFDKQLSRTDDPLKLGRAQTPDPTHPLNFEFLKKSLRFVGPKFELRTGHQNLQNQSVCLNQNQMKILIRHIQKVEIKQQINQLHNYSTFTHGISFDKSLPRNKEDCNDLPSYMQKTINSRQNLSTINHKSLQENSYQKGRQTGHTFLNLSLRDTNDDITQWQNNSQHNNFLESLNPNISI